MIYTTGDSHADHTFAGIPGIKVHSYAALTMQRIGYMEDTLIPDIVATMDLKLGDWLILSSGEVDCRWLVKPQVDHRKISLEELLHGWVERYLTRAITLPLNGARVAICGVPPPVPEGEIPYAGTILPVAGSNAERVQYVTTLNRLLAEECAKHEMPFIDIYSPHANDAGLLRPELSDGCVHVIKNSAVKDELIRLGILAYGDGE